MTVDQVKHALDVARKALEFAQHFIPDGARPAFIVTLGVLTQIEASPAELQILAALTDGKFRDVLAEILAMIRGGKGAEEVMAYVRSVGATV